MKFASLKKGRDGELVLLSKDTQRCLVRPLGVPTLQALLDEWDDHLDAMAALYEGLNAGGQAESRSASDIEYAAPLPRSYQYLDGASYHSHIERNRKARGSQVPADFFDKPLVYQGISHGFMAWNDPILANPEFGIDFEAEIVAITGDVPMGTSAQDALRHIRLFGLLNDVSLRALIPAELARSFGFLVGKPASALGPIVVTPDELGALWANGLVGGEMRCWVRGEGVGTLDPAIDTPYHYGDLIAHVAQTRAFEPGTLVGLGTISNVDRDAGCGCIGEIRALQMLDGKEPDFAFLADGDSVRIEHFDESGASIFGAIEQRVVGAK